MELKIEISFEQLLALVHQSSEAEKKELLTELQKSLDQLADGQEKRDGFGIWKGKVWMADDFDEPLDDFKEYM
jgi:hypothetical protein